MKTFEIMFSDLTEEAQKRFLEFQGIDSEKDGNYEVFPITCLEMEDFEKGKPSKSDIISEVAKEKGFEIIDVKIDLPDPDDWKGFPSSEEWEEQKKLREVKRTEE